MKYLPGWFLDLYMLTTFTIPDRIDGRTLDQERDYFITWHGDVGGKDHAQIMIPEWGNFTVFLPMLRQSYDFLPDKPYYHGEMWF